MGQQTTNVVRAFLQGLTGAGLFRRVSYPGAPVAFVDPNSADEIRIRGGLQREIAFSRRDGIPKHLQLSQAVSFWICMRRSIRTSHLM